MRCTSTEYLLNFWPSYRQWSRYHFTSYHGKTAILAVRWLAQMLWVGKVSLSNNKLKFNHSESHCGIVWLHFLLHQDNAFPNISNLLQTTERTVIWWVKCAWSKSRNTFLVLNERNSEIKRRCVELFWRWFPFYPKSERFVFLQFVYVCTTAQDYRPIEMNVALSKGKITKKLKGISYETNIKYSLCSCLKTSVQPEVWTWNLAEEEEKKNFTDLKTTFRLLSDLSE